MTRRIGFGDSTRRARIAEMEKADALDAAENGQDGSEDASPAKKAGPFARLFIILFLLVWLALWSYAIITAWDAARDTLANFEWTAFDIAMLAFFAVWLGGALVGWAFGVVILVLMLFGKEANRSPTEQAERWKRKRARRRGEDDI